MTAPAEIRAWHTAFAPTEGFIVPPGDGMPSPTGAGNMAKAWSANTGGLLAVEEVTLPPSSPGPRQHYHTNYAEVFYILEGELLLRIGKQTMRATSGTFGFCLTGCVHAFRVVGSEPVRLLIMVLPPGPSEGYFVELAQVPEEEKEEQWQRLSQKWGPVVVGPPLESEA